MKIAIVSQFYAPDPEGYFVRDLAEHWANGGHEVRVVTSVPVPSGPVVPDGRALRITGGVGPRYSRYGLFARLRSHLFFSLSAAAWLIRSRERWDVVIGVSRRLPPGLPTGRTIRWVLDRRSAAAWRTIAGPLAHVRPPVPSQEPSTPSREVFVAISPAIGAHLRGSHPRAIVADIPLWAPLEVGVTPGSGVRLRRQRGVPETALVVLYHGNLGLAYDFEVVLDAARRVADRGIFFSFVGEGPRGVHLEQSIRNGKLGNVRLTSAVRPEDLNESLSTGDIHIVPLKPAFDGASFPSKFVTALAAGRPLLVTGHRDSELARLVARTGCGLVVPADGAEIAAALADLPANRPLLAEMGAKARQLFEREFAAESGLAAWDRLLQRISGLS